MSYRWDFSLYIDGTWTGDDEQAPIEVINPATEKTIGLVAHATTKTAIRAIEAARRAFDEGPWPWMKPADRAAALVRMAEALEAKSDDLHDLAVMQTGSVGYMTDLFQGVGAVGILRSNAADVVRGLQWVEPIGAPTGGLGVGGQALFREPFGVVAAITPFNYPFMLNLVKVAPALAVGCTVVLKPHPYTPLDAMLIGQAADEAGIPPGVFNVITGHGEVGDELTSNPMVDMVTFTGSTTTGRRIMKSAADTVKRVQLELGGKSAQVILEDVSEEYAHTIGFGQVMMHCGQGCALQTRLVLPTHLLSAYRDGVAAAATAVRIGDPADPATTLGPLIREEQRTRVAALVQSAGDEGGEILTGGQRPASLEKGFYFEPTVIVGDNSMRVAQEEIFGPVLTVIPYSGGDDEAARIANDSIYGLAGGVVSKDSGRAFNVGRRIRAGLVMTESAERVAAPGQGPGDGQGPGWGSRWEGPAQEGAFGGYKQSGLGREWGRHGLEDFTEIKSLSWT